MCSSCLIKTVSWVKLSFSVQFMACFVQIKGWGNNYNIKFLSIYGYIFTFNSSNRRRTSTIYPFCNFTLVRNKIIHIIQYPHSILY